MPDYLENDKLRQLSSVPEGTPEDLQEIFTGSPPGFIGSEDVGTPYETLGKYDQDLVFGMSQEFNRGRNQPWYAQAFNATIGGLASGLLTFVEDASLILDMDNNIKRLAGIEEVDGNWISKAAQEWKQDLSRDVFPIYKQSYETIDLSDPGFYWEALRGTLDSAVGFGLTGLGAGAAAKGLATLAKTGLRGTRLGAYLKGLNEAANVLEKGATITTGSFIMNYGEGKMMALELYENSMKELDQKYPDMPKDQKMRIAGLRADQFQLGNMAMMISDAFALSGIARGVTYGRQLIKDKSLKTFGKDLLSFSRKNPLAQASAEALEEIYQNTIQLEGQYQAQKDAADITGSLKPVTLDVEGIGKEEPIPTTLASRLFSFATSDKAILEGAMGFFGGPIQYGIIQHPFTIADRKAQKERYDYQQRVIGENQKLLEEEVKKTLNYEEARAQALASGEKELSELLEEEQFSDIVFRNYQAGTLDALERQMQEMVEEDNEEKYGAGYKERIRNRLQDVKTIEEDIGRIRQKYPNPVFSGFLGTIYKYDRELGVINKNISELEAKVVNYSEGIKDRYYKRFGETIGSYIDERIKLERKLDRLQLLRESVEQKIKSRKEVLKNRDETKKYVEEEKEVGILEKRLEDLKKEEEFTKGLLSKTIGKQDSSVSKEIEEWYKKQLNNKEYLDNIDKLGTLELNKVVLETQLNYITNEENAKKELEKIIKKQKEEEEKRNREIKDEERANKEFEKDVTEEVPENEKSKKPIIPPKVDLDAPIIDDEGNIIGNIDDAYSSEFDEQDVENAFHEFLGSLSNISELLDVVSEQEIGEAMSDPKLAFDLLSELSFSNSEYYNNVGNKTKSVIVTEARKSLTKYGLSTKITTPSLEGMTTKEVNDSLTRDTAQQSSEVYRDNSDSPIYTAEDIEEDKEPHLLESSHDKIAYVTRDAVKIRVIDSNGRVVVIYSEKTNDIKENVKELGILHPEKFQPGTKVTLSVDTEYNVDGETYESLLERGREAEEERLKDLSSRKTYETRFNEMLQSGDIRYVREDDITKPCAALGAVIGFTAGGSWGLVKTFKGKSHASGGINISISKNEINLSGKDGKIEAADGLVINGGTVKDSNKKKVVVFAEAPPTKEYRFFHDKEDKNMPDKLKIIQESIKQEEYLQEKYKKEFGEEDPRTISVFNVIDNLVNSFYSNEKLNPTIEVPTDTFIKEADKISKFYKRRNADVEVIPLYNNLDKFKKKLNNLRENDDVVILGHSGNKLMGIPNNIIAKELARSKPNKAYLGSCDFEKYVDSYNIPKKIYYKPKGKWYGVNPEGKTFEEAMYGVSDTGKSRIVPKLGKDYTYIGYKPKP